MWRRYERASYFKACMLEKALDLFYPLEEEEKDDTRRKTWQPDVLDVYLF